MSAVSTWRGFAYMDGDDDGVHDETRNLADWQLEDFVRWCQHRGYDHVYLCRTAEPSTFEKRPPPDDVRHHFG